MDKLKRQQSTLIKKSTLSTAGKIIKTKNQKNVSKRLDRGHLLEQWRKEKGLSRKENCHPLLSRKRSLAQIVSSPSYKPLKVEHKEINSEYHFDRRKTFVISQKNQPIASNYLPVGSLKDKRKTIHGMPEASKPNTSKNNRRKSMFSITTTTIAATSNNKKPTKQNCCDNKIAAAPAKIDNATIIAKNALNLPKSLSSIIGTTTSTKKAKIEKRRTIQGLPSFKGNKQDSENVEFQKQQQPNPKDKRKSIQFTTTSISSKKLTSPKPFTSAMRNQEADSMQTPWRNESLSRRERLDIWLAAKGKTPYTERRRSAYKSPHPKKFKERYEGNNQGYSNKSTTTADTTTIADDVTAATEYDHQLEDNINNQLETILNSIDNDHLEAQNKLEKLRAQNEQAIVKLANYWICKARLAALVNSVQNVISLLDQACVCEAKPEEKIRDEICRYLQEIEDEEDVDQSKENTTSDRLNYAITPGRRVHFANRDSPLDFKSSIIRFCIVESTAFKRRLNMQLKRKIMTPVRRSARLQRSNIIPEYLRADDRIIESPTQVEQDIIDGRIGFVPSKYLNTPLNNGWLLDEREDVCTDAENEEKEEDGNECVQELSFLG